MSFQRINPELRNSGNDPLSLNFPQDFEELNADERIKAKRFNEDSDLPKYIRRGTVSVWQDPDQNTVIRKKEQRVVDGETSEFKQKNFSEFEKAVMFGELGISPQVYSFKKPEIGSNRDYVMNFLEDFTNFQDKNFDSTNELEPYAEATGYIMGVLNEIQMVNGDLISPRKKDYSNEENDFTRAPAINNMLVGGRTEEVKLIDPEVARFPETESEPHKWSRSPRSYDIIEQEAPNQDTETKYVWRAIISEALASTELGNLLEPEDISYMAEDRKGNKKPETNFLQYLEDSATEENFYDIDSGIPRFEFEQGEAEEYFDDQKVADFADEVNRITDSYIEGFDEGREYAKQFDWPGQTKTPKSYLQEVRESLT